MTKKRKKILEKILIVCGLIISLALLSYIRRPIMGPCEKDLFCAETLKFMGFDILKTTWLIVISFAAFWLIKIFAMHILFSKQRAMILGIFFLLIGIIAGGIYFFVPESEKSGAVHIFWNAVAFSMAGLLLFLLHLRKKLKTKHKNQDENASEREIN